MRRDAGFTLMEALLALVLTSVVTGTAVLLFTSSESVFQTQPDAVEMQERLRGAADVLVRDLTMAGAGMDAGTDAGSLAAAFAPVVPRRLGVRGDPPDVVRSDAITITYVPRTHAQTTTLDVAPQAAGILVADAPSCPAGRPACGLQTGMTVALFDRTGQHDVFTVTAVRGPAAQVRPHARTLSYLYPAGARVAQVESRSYYLDVGNQQLRQYDGLASDVPVADDVVGFSFEYFGDMNPPGSPVPPEGVENCLYDASGGLKPMPTLEGVAGSEVPLPLPMLNDGPWCGVGDSRFDADLLRVRSVRVTLRVQAALPAFRAEAPAFFSKGMSRDSRRYLPDLATTFQVRPRNLGLVR